VKTGSAARELLPRRSLAVGLGALILSVPGLGCGGDETSSEVAPATAAPGAVEVGDFFFAPASKSVGRGVTVTWSNSGEQLHTVKGPGFASQAFGHGESYRFRFRRPGTFRYICTLHPTQMKGTIIVR
jgi:plastocyanin